MAQPARLRSRAALPSSRLATAADSAGTPPNLSCFGINHAALEASAEGPQPLRWGRVDFGSSLAWPHKLLLNFPPGVLFSASK